MLTLVGIVIGALFGAWRAKRRGGNRLDVAQWGAVYAILFGLAGLILAIALARVG
jgi:hypothetical protein